MTRSLALLALLPLLACGDKEPATPKDTGAADSGDTGADTADTTDTGADTADTGDDTGETGDDSGDTGDTAEPPPLANTGYWGPDRIALLLADTEESGKARIAVYDPSAGTITETPDARVGDDSTIQCSGDSVWVLDDQPDSTLSDRGLRIDPVTGNISTRLSFEDGWTPIDVLQVREDLWVAGSEGADLRIFDAAGTQTGTVDLSSLVHPNDTDLAPDFLSLTRHGPNVFLVAERRDRTNGNSFDAQVVEVDQAGLLIRRVDLSKSNPSGKVSFVGEVLYVHFGSSDAATADGGVEAFDLADSTSLGLVVDDSTDGRIQSRAWMDFGSNLYELYDLGDGNNHVGVFDITTGTAQFDWAYTGQAVAMTRLGPSVWFAEGATLQSYAPATGAPGTAVEVGSEVILAVACQKGSEPPEPDDTGDTGGDTASDTASDTAPAR